MRQWLQQPRGAVASNELKGAQEVCQRTADYPVVISGIAPTEYHADWDARLHPRFTSLRTESSRLSAAQLTASQPCGTDDVISLATSVLTAVSQCRVAYISNVTPKVGLCTGLLCMQLNSQ